MLPVETVKEIARLAVAGEMHVIKPEAEPDHVYYLRRPDGSYTRETAIGEPDRHVAKDLTTLARVVVARAADGCGPEVWYERQGFRAVLDTSSQHPPKCFVQLTPSPQLAKLLDWERAGKAVYEQKDLILALRTLFADSAPETLLPAVRNVKTNKAAEVQQQIQQGKVSLGKSMVAEMTGTAAIPEEVVFHFRVFAEAAFGRIFGKARVAIDPDPETGRFVLVVLPGDLERAFGEAEDLLEKAVREHLKAALDEAGYSDPVPVYRGSP
jgi:hypothetical protein